MPSLRHASLAALALVTACAGAPLPRERHVARPVERPAPANPEATSAAVVAAPPPDRAATPLPDALPVDPALGAFAPVLQYSDVGATGPTQGCLHMFPGFTEIAPTPRGAWILGTCGIRLRFLDGKIEHHRPPVKQMPIFGAQTCTAHRMHWSIWAGSDEEAFLLGSPRCGPDPSAVWQNELERWDGRAWLPLRHRFGAGDPHESDAFQVTGARGTLWAIVEGDSWHGPPDNALVQLVGARPVEQRSALGAEARRLLAEARRDPPANADKIPNVLPYEDYEAFVAPSPDELWVVGAEREYVQRNADGHGEPERHVSGAVWRFERGAWSTSRVADEHLRAIAVAPDGTVFAAGDGVWRRSASGDFEILARGWAVGELAYGVQAMVARGANDVWVAFGCQTAACAGPVVAHHDGEAWRRVAVSLPPGASDELRMPRSVRLAAVPGGPIWLAAEAAVWRLP